MTLEIELPDNAWNRRNAEVIAEFRANGGRVGDRHEGRELLLLHTTGARSGKPRITPLVTMRHGDSLVIIASKGGSPTHPDWYYNVVADPHVEVEYGVERFEATVEVVDDEPRRTQLYDAMAAVYPFFDTYRRGTDRTIPLILLHRRADPA